MKIRSDVPKLEREIVELLTRAGHTLVRTDWELALVATPEAAATLRRDHPTAAIIVVTRIGDVAARVRALELGADDAFDASFAPAQMMVRKGSAALRHRS